MRRSLLTIVTTVAFALAATATAQAVVPPTAGCGPSGPITVVSGEGFSLAMGFTNGGNDVNFTATMRANAFYGPEHVFATQHIAGGENLGVNKNFDFISTTGFPAATHRVLIDITSDKTGGTILGSCDIMLVVGSGDADGDGLYDDWETAGVDVNDGGVDLTLPGANAQRKDLYVEIDCIVATDHSHCPRQDALTDVVKAFANAPVANPDGTTGIQLHLDTGALFGSGVTNVSGTGGVVGTIGNLGGGGTGIAEAGNTIVDWDGATGSAGTNFYTIKTAAFDRANRSLVYRYALFAHQVNARSATNDCTSGWSDGIPGVDVIVSLGGLRDNDGNGTGDGPCWTSSGGFSVGSRAEQAGTFMHEFGHTLGLGHGGGDDVNLKPNYLSLMNYGMQMCSVVSSGALLPGGCDYSRDALPSLDERTTPGLDECKGLGDPYGLGKVDFNGDGNFTGASCAPASGNVSFDINGDGDCVGPGANGALDTTKAGDDVVSGTSIKDGPDLTCNTAKSGDDTQDAAVGAAQPEPLAGYDDWDNIVYDFRSSSAFASGTAHPDHADVDPQTLERAQQQLEQVLDADLSVVKTGPAEATPGDVVDYTLTVYNKGPGPAVDSKLSDMKPDGSLQSFDLGKVDAGQTVTRHVSYTIPIPSTNGATLTDTATVEGKNAVGNEQADATNDVSSVTTTVAAPVLTFGKATSAAAMPGDAITYTLTYENTGGGAGEGVAISDTLPAGIYYTTALDTGSGPRPTTVAHNANGTTTLVWTIGHVAKHSGPQTIRYTARTGLLAAGGDMFTNSAALGFDDKNGNHYPGLAASATTVLSPITPAGGLKGIAWWRSHPAERTAEFLARIQATDQRFDTNHDGALSASEVTSALAAGDSTPAHALAGQLLVVELNLASHRAVAATRTSSKLAGVLGLTTVGRAVVYAQDTLAVAWSKQTSRRYADATAVLTAINEFN